MRRTAFALAALLLAALAAAGLRRATGVHVSGDGAPALAALSTAPAGTAAVELVLLRRWQNLEALPALRRLCRAACDGTAPVVRLRQPSPRGLRTVVLVDVGALGAGVALDRGAPLPAPVARCLARAAERGGTEVCGHAPRTAWRLPFGL
ncbi:hypothetical protein [Jannaschia sp. W003]|uniref:hypothetical protein n=1 Tax=Jannaschia sp. W003 TaxID=2867012 RepID=UPI0021A43D6D|nr:hypothetical protein [Jannaschia sp. W003]UWQ22255.1 hypothetical protein K3554_04265 [Jannaschia sp. W003]